MKTIFAVLIVMVNTIMVINALARVILQQNLYTMKIVVVSFVRLLVKVSICSKNQNIHISVYHCVLV